MPCETIDEMINKIVRVYSKYIDDDLDIYSGNRYLTVVIEALIHETLKGELDRKKLQEIAMKLRDTILEGPGSLNPYVMELLGILEESTNDENLEEALNLAKRLLKEDRFDKLEV